MTRKSIMEEMEEIQVQADELKKLIDDNTTLACNKIWMPGKGVITLWETKN